jgi:dihydrofolate reductase
LRVFENVSVDGFFVDANNDMSWAHKADDEWNAFTSGNAGGDGALLFGRVTYEMMAGFWTTRQAEEMLPAVAAGMNRMPKFVASRTLARAEWHNTTVLSGDLVESVRALKATPGPDLVILGSGSVVSQLTAARLIDEYQIVVSPIVLGRGRTLFDTVAGPLPLTRTQWRSFGNGNVVLWYTPAR